MIDPKIRNYMQQLIYLKNQTKYNKHQIQQIDTYNFENGLRHNVLINMSNNMYYFVKDVQPCKKEIDDYVKEFLQKHDFEGMADDITNVENLYKLELVTLQQDVFTQIYSLQDLIITYKVISIDTIVQVDEVAESDKVAKFLEQWDVFAKLSFDPNAFAFQQSVEHFSNFQM